MVVVVNDITMQAEDGGCLFQRGSGRKLVSLGPAECRTRFTIGTLNKEPPAPKLFSGRYPLLSDRLGGPQNFKG